MNPVRRGLVAAAMLGSVFAGGAIGVALFGPTSATAQTTTTTPSSSGSTSTTAPAGTFHSNETPSHEAAESPSGEAAENSGQGHCAHAGTQSPTPSNG